MKESCFIIFLSISLCTIGQNSSFQLEMNNSPNQHFGNFIADEDGNLLFTCLAGGALSQFESFIVAKLEDNGEVTTSSIFTVDGSTPIQSIKALYKNEQLVIVQRYTGSPISSSELFGGPALIVHDFSLDTTWTRIGNGQVTGLFTEESSVGFDVDNNNHIILAYTPNAISAISGYPVPNIFELYFYTPTGMTVWRKGLQLLLPDSDEYSAQVSNIYLHPDGFYIMSGTFRNIASATGATRDFIIKTDLQGNPLAAKAIHNNILYKMAIGEDGGIYLLGKTDLQYNFTDNEENAILIKLDANLNKEWARVYFGENFEYKESSINSLPDGNLVFSYSTFGAFPVALAKLDPLGEIIWEKGYPLFEPKINTLNDGSLLMHTRKRFDENGNIYTQFVIAKTDIDGNVQGCETFPVCLESQDVDIEFSDFVINTIEIEEKGTYEILQESYDVSFTEICDSPPPPSPVFSFVDTLCVNNCGSTLNVNNTHAQGVEWHLTGPNTDSIKYSSQFNFCFNESGAYELTQTVWFLGCGYSHTELITVLEDLQIQILPQDTICQLPETGEVVANRPLVDYLWQDGSAESNISILESGTLHVSVSDGFCEASDTVSLSLLDDFINTDLVIQIPTDTLICLESLPLFITPQSNLNTHFSLTPNNFSQEPLQLEQEGKYTIFTTIGGCLLDESLTLDVIDCNFPAYLPNIFSPNYDGINDLFFPQGEHIQFLELSVFDRWGSLVFFSNDIFPSWDGRVNGKKAIEGVYIWHLSYRNLLTGEKISSSGDVTLIR